MTVSFLKLKFEKLKFVKQADYIGYVTTKLSKYTKITPHIKIYQNNHADFLSFFQRGYFKKKRVYFAHHIFCKNFGKKLFSCNMT